jgi:hypothetical protein
MTKPDILCASGAVHDLAGAITSLVPNTDNGRRWLINTMGADLSSGAAIIETEHLDHTLACIDQDGLTASAA